jgi:hypothetical protein
MLSFFLVILCLWAIDRLLLPGLGNTAHGTSQHSASYLSTYEGAAATICFSFLIADGAIRHFKKLVQPDALQPDLRFSSLLLEHAGLAFYILLVFLATAGSLSLMVGFSDHTNRVQSDSTASLSATKSTGWTTVTDNANGTTVTNRSRSDGDSVAETKGAAGLVLNQITCSILATAIAMLEQSQKICALASEQP